jgi:hypothetical protein
MDWLEFKNLAAGLGLGKDALHIYFAFLIHILAAAGLRRPLGHWMPWAVVLLAAMLNEVLDIRFGNEVPWRSGRSKGRGTTSSTR